MQYFFSPSTLGFYLADIHGDNIPPDAIKVTAEERENIFAEQSAGKIVDVDSNGKLIYRDSPPFIPKSVTMRQARLALLQAGLLDDVDVAIASLPSPQKEAAKIEWEYSQEVHRNKDFVKILAGALQLNDEQLDELFVSASML